jgi:hypothetical protein
MFFFLGGVSGGHIILILCTETATVPDWPPCMDNGCTLAPVFSRIGEFGSEPQCPCSCPIPHLTSHIHIPVPFPILHPHSSCASGPSPYSSPHIVSVPFPIPNPMPPVPSCILHPSPSPSPIPHPTPLSHSLSHLVQVMGIPAGYRGGTCTRTRAGINFNAMGTGIVRVSWESNKKHAKNIKFWVCEGIFDF